MKRSTETLVDLKIFFTRFIESRITLSPTHQKKRKVEVAWHPRREVLTLRCLYEPLSGVGAGVLVKYTLEAPRHNSVQDEVLVTQT